MDHDLPEYKSIEDQERDQSIKTCYQDAKFRDEHDFGNNSVVELDQLQTVFEQQGPLDGISLLGSIRASSDDIIDFFSVHSDLLQMIIQALSSTTNLDELRLIIHNIIQLSQLSPFIIISFIESGILRFIDDKINSFPENDQILYIFELLTLFSSFSPAIAQHFMKLMPPQFIEFICNSDKSTFSEFLDYFKYCYDSKTLTRTTTSLLFHYTEMLLFSKHTRAIKILCDAIRTTYLNSTEDYSLFITSNIISALLKLINTSFYRVQDCQPLWLLIGTLYRKKIIKENFDYQPIFANLWKNFNHKAQFWCLHAAIVERKIDSPLKLCRLILTHWQDYFCFDNYDSLIEGGYCLLSLFCLLDSSELYPLISEFDFNPIFLKFLNVENTDFLHHTVDFFEKRFIQYLIQTNNPNYLLKSQDEYKEVISDLSDSDEPMIRHYGRDIKSSLNQLFPDMFSNHSME